MTLALEPAVRPSAVAAAELPQLQRAGDVEKLNVLGQTFEMRVTPEQTGGAMFVFDCHAPAGCGVPTHVHDDEDETFIVRRGSAEFVVDGRSMILHAGDSIFAPRGIPHAWSTVGPEPLDVTTIVTPGNLVPMFREIAAMTAFDPARLGEICGRANVRFA